MTWSFRLLVPLAMLWFAEAACAQQYAGWLGSLEKGAEAAAKSGKPIFVVFRCERCPECWQWDVQVGEEDADIKRLREEFVCVRIGSMNGMNLRKFDFDYDVTWNGFFLDDRLNVYSRYGGRDGGDPEARLHKDGLMTTMRRVLADHVAARKAREGNGAKPAAPSADSTSDPPAAVSQWLAPVPAGTFTPEDIPLLKRKHEGCVHCHQVREYQLLQWGHDGEFDRRKLFCWPLPENVGISLDLKDGARVSRVTPESLAAKAGMRAGDLIVRANETPIRSEYDLRWVLHRLDEGKPLRLMIERGEAADSKDRSRVTVEMTPTGDWRQTDIGWRKSMRSVPIELGMRGYSITRTQRKELQVAEDVLALKIVATKPKGLAANLGVQKGDVIVAHDKQTADRTFEQFLSDLLRQHQPGDTVRVTVLRNGERISLSGKLPDWHTEETTVPVERN